MVTNNAANLPTAVAIGLVVYALAVAFHETCHVIAGYMVGGRPTFLSSTDLRGDWTGVTHSGWLWIVASGSVGNWVLGAIGIALAPKLRSASGRYFAWLLGSANGLLASTYLAFAPLIVFGDAATFLQSINPPWIWRVLFSALGFLLAALFFEASRRSYCHIVDTASRDAVAAGRSAVLASFMSGGALLLGAATFSPLEAKWVFFVAFGGGFGTTWPILITVQWTYPRYRPLVAHGIPRSRGWILAGIIVSIVYVLVFGPGVELPAAR